jgi:ankyrin repeat protein
MLLLSDGTINPELAETPYSAFACAAGSRNVELVKLLLNDDRDDVNKRTTNGTALGYAAFKGQSGCLKLIMQCERVDVTMLDKHGCTLLHDAARTTVVPKSYVSFLKPGVSIQRNLITRGALQ